MRIGARRSGTRVQWFTDQVGKSTHTFNLFLQPFCAQASRRCRRTGLVAASLGTSHGLAGYGSQWFGGAAFEVLLKYFERFDIVSWMDLLDKIKLVRSRPRDYGLDKEMTKAAGQLVFDVGRLTRIAPLNTPHSSIDLSSDEPTAIYWDFSGLYDMAGVVSRLALFSIFAAASNTERPEIDVSPIRASSLRRRPGNPTDRPSTRTDSTAPACGSAPAGSAPPPHHPPSISSPTRTAAA